MVARIARDCITIVIPKHFKVDHEQVQTLDDAYVKNSSTSAHALEVRELAGKEAYASGSTIS
jgi:predicted acyltransferase (DUF342 family)